jgi:hypothetical protein
MTSRCNFDAETLGEHAEFLMCRLREDADTNLDIDSRLERLKKLASYALIDLYKIGEKDDILPPPLKDMLHDLIVFGLQHDLSPDTVDYAVEAITG